MLEIFHKIDVTAENQRTVLNKGDNKEKRNQKCNTRPKMIKHNRLTSGESLSNNRPADRLALGMLALGGELFVGVQVLGWGGGGDKRWG